TSSFKLSTPVKTSRGKILYTSRDLDEEVVSDDEDTFSLLSPIYHDSFDSDEEDLEPSPAQQTSPRPSENSGRSPAASPTLSAWEMWLVNKAKEDRIKLEKKAEEERLLKKKTKQQEREHERKKIVMEEKIHEWLKLKKEQHEQLVKQSKEEEEIQRQLEKQRQIEQKAQQKYKDWLQKKNQEKIEKEKKEKVMCFFSVCFSFYKDILMLMTKQPDSERDSFLFTGGSSPEGRAGEGAPQEGRGEV
uniref:Coiled-coil domain-containing protein n=1 Tax=Seriola lalandi dorsalis TaxID=1841481 RepID=A0A3B4XD50_SERLL